MKLLTWVRLGLVVLLLAATSVVVAQDATPTPERDFITMEALPLYERPDTTSPVEVVIPEGEQVRRTGPVREGEDGNQWMRVRYGNALGFVLYEGLQPASAVTPTVAARTFYVVNGGANFRTCPRLVDSCDDGRRLSAGTAVQVTGEVQGDAFSGSTVWYEVTLDGETGVVHSALLTQRLIQATAAPVVPQVQQPGAPVSTAQPVQPTSVIPPVVPTTAPPVSTQPPGPSFACNCAKTCTQMVSCDEAYFQLRDCGCGERDSDNDGVPCESICGGG